MKRMVAVSIIATLILLAIVGVASAYGVKVDKVTVNGGNPSNTTVGYTSNTFFYVVFDVTSGVGGTHNQVLNFTTLLTITANNISKTYDPYPSQMRNIVNNKTYPIPQLPGPEKIIETGKYEVRFEPIRFYDDFDGIKVAKIAEVKYNISFKYSLGRDSTPNDPVSGHGPGVFPPKPEIITGIPPKIYLYYQDNLEVEFCVNDVMGNRGSATLKAYKPPHYNGTPQFEEPGKRSYQGGDEYCHTWKIEQKYHNFSSADEDKIFKLCVDYDPVHYKIYPNWSCGRLQVTEYIPKVIADLGSYSKEGTRQKLSEEDWKNIYVEKDDLHDKFRFNATIEDERGKGTAILEVCGVNDSVGCKNYSLAGPSDGSMHQYSNESILFNEGNFSLRLYYNRSNLPPWWPCPSKPWKVYNITIFPFSINFTNAIVSPPSGSWNDTFNYSVDVKNATKDLPITLRVFDPYREREPWIKLVKPDIEGPPTFKWTDRRPFENYYCAGESKFYFEYSIEGYQGESPVYLGPTLILEPPIPTFDNESVDPNVTIYCNWSKSSTPCNYSVNVTTKDEYTVTLFVMDPTGKWILKGDKEISNTNKNITWTNITPFESLNMDDITQYIDNGTRADFSFEYNGHKANKNFSGPLLVAAFKEPMIVPDPKNISYNKTFYYNVDVIGSKNLNITLKYLCDEYWISANITDPTKEYNTNITKWELLTWECKAINTWEDVRFDVNVTGEEIEVY